MADVITRFKLETTQFDSKLRDTAKQLQSIARQAEKAGKDFSGFDKGAIEAARALGTVASGATNAKDKLRDLVGSFNDASKAYNSLTDEAKRGEFGQALSASLQKLQRDIKQTKEELYGIGDGAKGGGGGFLSGITGTLAVAGGNLIASGITKLAGEMKETVQQSIELARQGEGVRIAFERLNQPGLLDRLKEATHGTVSEIELMKQAIKFENFKLPLDDLATYLAFAQQKAKDTGESIDFLVNSIVNGLGRQSKQILDNLGISAAELTKRMNEGADMTKAVADIIREEMAKAGDYVETAADRAAVAAATATDKMEDLGRKAIPMAESWTEAWNSIKLGGMELLTVVLNPIADSINYINSLLASTPEDVFTKNWKGGQVGSNIDDKGNYIKRPAQKGAAGFDWDNGTWKPGYSGAIYNSATGQTELPEISVSGKKITKNTPKGGSGSKSTSTPKSFFDMINKVNLGADALKGSDIKDTMSVWAMMSDEAKESMLGLAKATEDLGDAQAKLGEDKVTSEIAERTKLIEQQQKAMNLAAQSATNFGTALASLDDPAAKAAGTVISAIANIALGFGQAVAQAGTMGPWAWLAYVAAGTAALATTISTVHSLTGYSEGGIVKGNSYSGDNVGGLVDGSQLVGLNAGELVLTKAMQSNLAGQLQGNGMSGLNLKTKVKGTELLVWLDNSLARSGRGELVTWGQ